MVAVLRRSGSLGSARAQVDAIYSSRGPAVQASVDLQHEVIFVVLFYLNSQRRANRVLVVWVDARHSSIFGEKKQHHLVNTWLRRRNDASCLQPRDLFLLGRSHSPQFSQQRFARQLNRQFRLADSQDRMDETWQCQEYLPAARPISISRHPMRVQDCLVPGEHNLALAIEAIASLLPWGML